MPNLQTTRTPMTLIGCINLVILGPTDRVYKFGGFGTQFMRVEHLNYTGWGGGGGGGGEIFVWIIEGSLNRRGYFFSVKL